ncbi:hypothetical protein LRS10_09405 [Phenylobacterium sp. J426]|uniref:hypothetical protein n=1 Tax=Phenylobacterium sp. J426 TaxID=2898439 RepID=UPI002151A602|nr:hypothetical protein [Phenylobacterium sp. J426]MCR5874359.1 hypothetical protein [Phenylobacterium sp. J426]
MPTPPPPVDVLPTAPNRSTMPASVFVAITNAFLGALQGFRAQLVALAANAFANATEAHGDAEAAEAAKNAALAAQQGALTTSTKVATSHSNLTMAAGVKTVVLQESGRTLEDDEQVVLIYLGDVESRMIGSITNIAGQALTVEVAEAGVVGTGGPYNRWAVISAALLGVSATAAEIRAFLSDYVNITPAGIAAASDFHEVAGVSGTLTPDMADGWMQAFTLTGDVSVAPIENGYVGQFFTLEFKQGGGGGHEASWDAGYKFDGDVDGVLTATAGKVDVVSGFIRSLSPFKARVGIAKGFAD